MSPLAFPMVSRPVVSIIMPIYGGWDYVERSLSAVIENTDPCYEVILVDNASPDGLGERLATEVRNARLLRNEVNRGFGCASNQGAAYATGEALVFLNSDAFVHPGWLPPLLERLAADERAAAVGPRILNTDGSLQEAGSLLFQNGYTQFYGFGDEATRPEYRFERRVDYLSAACLIVRRRHFSDVGGFDAAYAPAYFEDVALCLALAARGLETIYEPRSTVTHVRGASSDPAATAAYWSRNLPIFQERWGSVLALRPAFEPDPDRLRGRIAARDVKAPVRLLLATDRIPEDRAGFGDSRALWLLQELATLYPDSVVTLLATAEPPAGVLEHLLALGVEVASPRDLPAWFETRAFHYDVALLSGPASAELFDHLERTQPQCYRVVDLGVARSSRYLRRTGGARRRQVSELEKLAFADLVMASAPSDLARARAIAEDIPSFLLPTPFQASSEAPGFSERCNLLFVATSDVEGDPDDAEALAALTDRVLPAIRRESPDLELTAVIRVNAKEISRLEGHGIHVVARDARAKACLSSARVLVAPFVSRPGRIGFLREAASAGLPFVVTPEAGAALPFEGVPPDALASDFVELARKTVALHREERRWVRLRHAITRAFAHAGAGAECRRTLVDALARVGCAPPRSGQI